MKKYLLLIIFLLSFFLSSAAVNTPAKQSSIIRVGVYDNPPKIFKDPQGRPCGFWVDIIKNIAEKENWEISWVHGSWSDSIKKLKNNEIDVMPDVAYSEERSKIFDFSEQTIFVNWARIFVPTDSNIISFLDLDGKKIGVMKKGIHYIGSNGIKNLIKRFDINATFIVYEGYFEILEAVQENQVDAEVVNRIFGHKYHKNYDVRRTSIIINPIELKFAFPKDTPKTSLLINKFDFHVDKLKKDEGSLYHRYVHDLLVPLKHEKKVFVLPHWIEIVGMITGGIFILLIIIIFLIKKQVNKKTVELKKSRKEWEEIFQAIGQPTLILGKNYRILNANKAAVKKTDLKLDQLKNKKCYDLYHNNNNTFKNCPVKMLLESNKKQVIQRQLHILGGYYMVTVTPIINKHGEIDKIIHIAINITERKKMENKLKQEEQRFRRIYEHMGVGIASVSLDFIFENANQAYCDMIGYNEKELRGKSLKDVTHKDDLEKLLKELNKLKTGINEHFRMERKYIHKEGHTVYAILDVSIVKDKKGAPQYFLGSVVDITERKLAEKEKNKLQKQLLQTQKLESIGTLTGGIAHDFNNMITVIKGTADLLLNRIKKDDKSYGDIENIYKSAVKAENLTKKLLLFSRKKEMEFEEININDIFDDLIEILNRLISENITIKTDLADDLWSIWGDSNHLEQVLINLAINARDAMPEGGKLYIRTKNEVITESRSEKIPHVTPGNYVRIDIEDTGKGMEKNILDNIFDPFFTTKGRSKGTGMGLSVVHGIIKNHKGFINVYSEVDEGTIFKIYLPVSTKKASPSVKKVKKNKKYKSLDGRGTTILIVEDEKDVLNLIEDVLKNYNYNYISAETGKKAKEVFREKMNEIDVLLSDIIITDYNGIELADEFKKIKPDLEVVLTSGYSNDKFIYSKIKEKGYSFIQKPFDIKDMLELIREKF